MLPPLISPRSRIGFFNVGDFLHFVIEHHGQTVAHVSRRKVVESLSAFAGQGEAHAGLAILIAAGLRVAQVFSAHRRDSGDQVPGLPFRRHSGRAMPRKENRIRRQNPAFILECGRLARIRPAERLLDLQHGGRLHDVFHACRIIDARQLHQNLVLPQPVFLNRGFADAKLVNAVANGLDGLRDRLILQVG